MEGFDRASAFWQWAALIPPLIFAITFHEVAHGWVAKFFGDPTAAEAGRLTLNPIKHVDPIGTIVVPIMLALFTPFVFGWAKPVPVNFSRLNSPRRDTIFVAAAGPGSNMLMALLWTLVLVIGRLYLPLWGQVNLLIDDMAQIGIFINLILAVFNMIPLPPLDGGRVLHGLLPPPMSKVLDYVEPFGILIIIGVMALDYFMGLDIFLRLILTPVARLSDLYYGFAEYLFMLAGVS